MHVWSINYDLLVINVFYSDHSGTFRHFAGILNHFQLWLRQVVVFPIVSGQSTRMPQSLLATCDSFAHSDKAWPTTILGVQTKPETKKYDKVMGCWFDILNMKCMTWSMSTKNHHQILSLGRLIFYPRSIDSIDIHGSIDPNCQAWFWPWPSQQHSAEVDSWWGMEVGWRKSWVLLGNSPTWCWKERVPVSPKCTNYSAKWWFSNINHPYLGKIFQFDEHIFQMGGSTQPPTRKPLEFLWKFCQFGAFRSFWENFKVVPLHPKPILKLKLRKWTVPRFVRTMRTPPQPWNMRGEIWVKHVLFMATHQLIWCQYT